MATFIDGVIEQGSSFGVQCLQWVNNVTHGAGAGFNTAADLAASAQSKGQLSQTPSLGAVAVWGQSGVTPQGHAAIVTNIGPNGEVGITGTNWPRNSGAIEQFVGHGLTKPLGYVDPTAIGGKNILGGPSFTGSTAGLQQTGASVSPTGTYKGLTQSVADAVKNGGTGSTFYGPITGFESWISQGTLLRRIGFTLFGVFLAWYGLHLLTQNVPNPVEGVGTAVGGVGATVGGVGKVVSNSRPKAPSSKPVVNTYQGAAYKANLKQAGFTG